MPQQEQAEYNVIVKASKDGYNYLAIVMKSPQQKIKNQSYLTKCSFVDAKSLFEWAFAATRATVSASFPFSTLTSPITSSLATMVVYFKLSNAHSKSDFASTKEHLVK